MSDEAQAAQMVEDGLRAGVPVVLNVIPHKEVLRLVIVGCPEINCVMIALEKKGCIFYDGTYPLDEFVLAGKGFDLRSAEYVCHLLGAVLMKICQHRLTSTAPQRALKSA